MTTNNNKIHTLSVYVSNRPGVLARIAQVFARRGFNIESLVVSPGKDGKFSRMTIGVSGNPDMLQQIVKQVDKLIDVLSCIEHPETDAVVRELALVKILCGPERRTEALQLVDHFNCKTVDLTDKSMVIMSTGASEKVNAFLDMVRTFDVVELVRTGKVLMARGDRAT